MRFDIRVHLPNYHHNQDNEQTHHLPIPKLPFVISFLFKYWPQVTMVLAESETWSLKEMMDIFISRRDTSDYRLCIMPLKYLIY